MAQVSLRNGSPKPPQLMVIATRNHGEYILQVGRQYFVESAPGRREVSRGFVTRLLSHADSNWDRRNPGTPYAPDQRLSDRQRAGVDPQDLAQGWSPERFSTSQPQPLAWIDPETTPGSPPMGASIWSAQAGRLAESGITVSGSSGPTTSAQLATRQVLATMTRCTVGDGVRDLTAS